MKKISKAFSLAIAAIMTLCLCSFGMVFDVGATDYTITIKPPAHSSTSSSGYSFTDHTFTAYKVFNASVDTNTNSYSYTITSDCLGYGDGINVEQSTHSYKKIENGATTKYNGTTIDSDAKAREFAEFLHTTYFTNGARNTTGNTTSTVSASANTPDPTTGNMIITTTSPGYYLVLDSYNGTNTVTSLVMLDTSAATSSGQNNVDINVKSDAATKLDYKKVRVGTEAWNTYTDCETGSTVDFLIQAMIPNVDVDAYSATTYPFKIIDTMDPCFTYVANSAKIYWKPANNTEPTLTDEFLMDNTKISFSASQTNNVLTMTIPDLKQKVRATVEQWSETEDDDLYHENVDGKFYRGQPIYIYYQAKFEGAKYANSTISNKAKWYLNNGSTDADKSTPNKNLAKLNYLRDPYSTTDYIDTTASSAYVWTFGFDLTKVEGTYLQALNGAEFQVIRLSSENDATSSTPMKFRKLSDGEYCVVADTETAVNTSNIGDITTTLVVNSGATVSNDKGKLIVYGFDQSKWYKIVESTPPSGYGKAEDTKFFVSPTYGTGTPVDGSTIASCAWAIKGKNIVDPTKANLVNTTTNPKVAYEHPTENDGVVTLTGTNSFRLWNSAGSELVGTGGIGTTIFYIAGGILMAGAAILLIVKLRMKNR